MLNLGGVSSVLELIKYGWVVNDIVGLRKEWCSICTKARWHEEYAGWVICMGCWEKTEPPAPPLQVERFMKETFNG